MIEGVPIPVLETPRLVLKPLDISDAPRIQSLFPHWEMLQYMADAIPWPYPADGAEWFVSQALPKIESGEEYHWAIFVKGRESEGMFGAIGLTPHSKEDSRGFWLAQELWGQGLMTEAVTAVNDFGFGPLGMEEMILNNAAANVASHRLKERSGAVIIGNSDRGYVSGRLPAVQWRLTKEAWLANRDTFASRG